MNIYSTPVYLAFFSHFDELRKVRLPQMRDLTLGEHLIFDGELAISFVALKLYLTMKL